METFELVTGLEELIDLTVVRTNLYAQQKGRNFTVDNNKLKAFLGINYIMAINNLPTVAEYWRVDNLIENNVIQNTMIRNRFCEILQHLHFGNNTYDGKTDRDFKVRPAIGHLNKKFAKVLSNDKKKTMDGHMVKFKERSRMKQYIKSKSIKWGFKFWFRCSNKIGYLYQMDIYLGKKQNTEFHLGEEVVLQLTKNLEGSFCVVYFGNFFNSPILIEKLFNKNIYAIGIARKNRKQMPKMLEDKTMKRCDCELLYLNNVMACKWMDNWSVLLVSNALEGMDDVSSVQRRVKGSATKSTVPCPTVVKLYNNAMGGVDLMDQRNAAYRLDRESSVRFYLRIFFDLLDIACVNSFIVYIK